MKKLLILSFLFFLLILVIPKKEKSPNIFLITLDGVRWQEVFYGIDKELVDNTNYVENKSLLIDTYYSPQLFERRKNSCPLHGIIFMKMVNFLVTP